MSYMDENVVFTNENIQYLYVQPIPLQKQVRIAERHGWEHQSRDRYRFKQPREHRMPAEQDLVNGKMISDEEFDALCEVCRNVGYVYVRSRRAKHHAKSPSIVAGLRGSSACRRKVVGSSESSPELRPDVSVAGRVRPPRYPLGSRKAFKCASSVMPVLSTEQEEEVHYKEEDKEDKYYKKD